MSRAARRTPALLPPQGGLSASLRRGRAVCPLVSAELARGVCAEIPRLFFAAEIAAVKMLLFFAGIGEDGYFDHAGRCNRADDLAQPALARGGQTTSK